VRETNATPSVVNISAGNGVVTLSGAVGASKDIGQLNITASSLTAGTIKTASGFSLTNSASVTLSSEISGAGALTKNGTGILTLSAANTYTGGTNINAGTLQVNSSTALGPSGTISMGGGVLQYTSNNTTDYSSRFSTAAGQAYNVDTNGQNVTWATGLTSSGATLTKLGTGTLTLSGANTYNGGSNINAGILLANSSSALGSSGVLSFGGGTLQYSASNTSDYSARISTAAGQAYKVDTNGQNVTWATALTSSGATLSKSGSGVFTLSGANTYSGGTTVSAGTLKMGVASVGTVGAITSSALGTGSVTVSSGGAIDLNGFSLLNSATVAGTGVSSGGALTNSSASAVTVSGPLTLSASSSLISTPGMTFGTVNGGAYALTVTAGTGAGTGDITLNGALTFSGENISTFTASRNIYINAPITVNGTTSASGIALKYNQANGGGDYVFGISTNGSGAALAASFSGAINFANTASTFTTQSYSTSKSYTLINAFTSSGASGTTFYCATAANCTASNSLNFALIGNIDASTFTTTGLAAGSKYANMRVLGNSSAAYAGTFTGLGHTVTGLTLSGAGNVGLFYSTANGAAVRDVRLTNTSITGTGNYTGALVGSAASSLTMTNVIMDGTSSVSNSASSYVGGLMGSAGTGTLSNIYVLTTNVTGGTYTGGVLGYGNMTSTNVHKVGNVTSAGSTVGGVFGYMSGTLTNVDSVGSVTVTSSNSNVGGLIGDAGASTITTASVTGAVTASASSSVGGLLGTYSSGTLTSVSATGGDISGTSSVGGLIGYTGSTITINGASATGNVTGTSSYVGGLVGYMYSTGTLSNVYATGNVQGTTGVGGLVGYMDWGYARTINQNSYASGTVRGTGTGTGSVGGLVGYAYGDINIYSSSYRGTSVWSDGSDVGGLVGNSPSGYTVNIRNSYVDTQGGLGVKGTYRVGGMVGSYYYTLNIASDGTNTSLYGAALAPYSTANVTGTTAVSATAYVGGLVGYASTYVYGYMSIDSARVTGSTVTGVGNYVGGMVGGTGTIYTTNITNSYVNGTSISGTGASSYVAGLVGYSYSSLNINNAYVNSPSITGTGNYVAGMVGGSAAVSISNSYVTSPISSTTTTANKLYFGGLVGDASSSATISNAYAIGNISVTGSGAGTSFVGGLVGRMGSSGGVVGGSMQNAYYSGTITTDANAVNYGGLAGYFRPGTWFSNSYYDMGNSTINGVSVLTVGGLYSTQYDAWAKQGGASVVVTPTSRLPLSIASAGLTQDATDATGKTYFISSTADLDKMLPFIPLRAVR
jgi:autotransporter-associated beta strand protein